MLRKKLKQRPTLSLAMSPQVPSTSLRLKVKIPYTQLALDPL